LIILASLTLAIKFLDDCHAPTQHYSSAWARNQWTCEQINVTERCIMESLGYRILPLWDRELIDDALSDMSRAGRQQQSSAPSRKSSYDDKCQVRSGKAVPGLGQQLTPDVSPRADDSGTFVDDCVRAAFISGRPEPAVTMESLHLPLDTNRNAFYV
jgi:hypothetical protein